MNILSIDLESWVHFYADALRVKGNYAPSVDRKMLGNNYISMVTERIINFLDIYRQKATFFVVGEIYEWYPHIIERIAEAGHEIGYHTHYHPILKDRATVEKELKRSSDFINRFNPIGFRAPQLFITRESISCLKENGFKYSSSTYDEYAAHSIEGIDEIPITAIPFRKKRGSTAEFPKHLTFDLLTRQIPFGSGLFIALLGSRTSLVIDYLNRRNIPAILIVHPWQILRPNHLESISFKIKVLRRNPLCLPYTFGVEKALEKLLMRHPFLPFKEYFNYE